VQEEGGTAPQPAVDFEASARSCWKWLTSKIPRLMLLPLSSLAAITLLLAIVLPVVLKYKEVVDNRGDPIYCAGPGIEGSLYTYSDEGPCYNESVPAIADHDTNNITGLAGREHDPLCQPFHCWGNLSLSISQPALHQLRLLSEQCVAAGAG